jgi:hypothetical protein
MFWSKHVEVRWTEHEIGEPTGASTCSTADSHKSQEDLAQFRVLESLSCDLTDNFGQEVFFTPLGCSIDLHSCSPVTVPSPRLGPPGGSGEQPSPLSSPVIAIDTHRKLHDSTSLVFYTLNHFHSTLLGGSGAPRGGEGTPGSKANIALLDPTAGCDGHRTPADTGAP